MRRDRREVRAGVLLAGGRGARMGADKPLVAFRGRPLLEWPLDVLAGVADEVLVMAGPDAARLAAHARPAVRVLPDPGEGPLGALLAAAQATRADWLAVAPADAPLLTRDVYDALFEAARTLDGALARAGGADQPLVAVVRRAPWLDAARCAWTAGRRSAHAALDALDVARVDLPPATVRDLDTRDDLRALDPARGPGP